MEQYSSTKQHLQKNNNNDINHPSVTIEVVSSVMSLLPASVLLQILARRIQLKILHEGAFFIRQTRFSPQENVGIPKTELEESSSNTRFKNIIRQKHNIIFQQIPKRCDFPTVSFSDVRRV